MCSKNTGMGRVKQGKIIHNRNGLNLVSSHTDKFPTLQLYKNTYRMLGENYRMSVYKPNVFIQE